MSHGLPHTAVAGICGVLAQFPEVERAVLHGSRAKGNYKPGSDIDLTLLGEGLGLPQLGTIAEALDDLLLPYQIDLSLYEQLEHPALRAHIDRVGVPLYIRAGAR